MPHDWETHEANNMAADEMMGAVSRLFTANDNLCPACVTMKLAQSLMISLILSAEVPSKRHRKMLKHFTRAVEHTLGRVSRGEVVVTTSEIGRKLGS